ncbi:ATP-dependent nuclease [Caulobacter sp. NIBR2454]|uniref:ATP-dependent nuclease n=1 Tax=Caulobacter sp. NIBR2454 TaxID=3015996 RepID=UPI0022B6540A|nr:AAA family ATPase [Caulobacter sp. NIBR2454]
MRSKLLQITVKNIGCIGPEAVTVKLDDVLCLVGPNNSGKTTILRAYELAVAPGLFDPMHDRCNWAPKEDPAEIVLDVHIPDGMGNVDAKWKIEDGDKRVVRSRWSWAAGGGKAVRQTWDPQLNDWAAEGKAGGADNVFASRLPKPMRIKSLDDAMTTEDVLLTLALSPFVKDLKALEADENSQLSKDKVALATTVNKLTDPHKKRLDEISGQIKTGFQGIFPGLGVKLHVEMPTPELKLEALLKQGSGIRIEEAAGISRVSQQGTGARRALFWAMLQVHNEISRQTERREGLLKSLTALLRAEEKKKDEEKIKLITAQISAIADGAPLPEDADDPALPGYILLIDEPENALHPMAARAAQDHLYTLGQHEDWQVLLTTHSPYFINPLEDHTTIVRMERSNDGKLLSPRVYVSDEVAFSDEEKENLQALQLTDAGFAEIFFGSYPILVEGDTEHAAFISAVVKDKDAMAGKVSIIRARGKAILVPLVKMLRHFKANFGIIHDIDWPYRKDGSANGMWTVNTSIRQQVAEARQEGRSVRHRWSTPDFERFLGGSALGKDKPYAAYARVSSDEALKDKVRGLMASLYDGDHDPTNHDGEQDFIAQIEASLVAWATDNNELANPRLTPKKSA